MAYLLPLAVLQKIVSIVRRRSPHFMIDRRRLREIDQGLYALLGAVGAKVDDSEYTLAFREAVNAKPSDYAMAEVFRQIAIAENPLAPTVCTPDALAQLEGLARTRRAIHADLPQHNRRYHLIYMTWDELPVSEQEALRQTARELEAKFRSRIRQGATEKSSQNALLIGLADIYLRATNDWMSDPLELPHSIRSFFIQFAHASASPFFPKTEVSLKALSDRWANWKRSQNRVAGKFWAEERQIRKRPKKLK